MIPPDKLQAIIQQVSQEQNYGQLTPVTQKFVEGVADRIDALYVERANRVKDWLPFKLEVYLASLFWMPTCELQQEIDEDLQRGVFE